MRSVSYEFDVVGYKLVVNEVGGQTITFVDNKVLHSVHPSILEKLLLEWENIKPLNGKSGSYLYTQEQFILTDVMENVNLSQNGFKAIVNKFDSSIEVKQVYTKKAARDLITRISGRVTGKNFHLFSALLDKIEKMIWKQ